MLIGDSDNPFSSLQMDAGTAMNELQGTVLNGRKLQLDYAFKKDRVSTKNATKNGGALGAVLPNSGSAPKQVCESSNQVVVSSASRIVKPKQVGSGTMKVLNRPPLSTSAQSDHINDASRTDKEGEFFSISVI